MRYRFILYASMAFAVVPTLFLGSWIAYSFPIQTLDRLPALFVVVWLGISGIIALPITGIYFLLKAAGSDER